MACWSAENAIKAYLSTLKMVSTISPSRSTENLTFNDLFKSFLLGFE